MRVQKISIPMRINKDVQRQYIRIWSFVTRVSEREAAKINTLDPWIYVHGYMIYICVCRGGWPYDDVLKKNMWWLFNTTVVALIAVIDCRARLCICSQPLLIGLLGLFLVPKLTSSSSSLAFWICGRNAWTLDRTIRQQEWFQTQRWILMITRGGIKMTLLRVRMIQWKVERKKRARKSCESVDALPFEDARLCMSQIVHDQEISREHTFFLHQIYKLANKTFCLLSYPSWRPSCSWSWV